MVLVKFWLHVSDEEQLKRFEARENDPLKRWKITDEDWRNREKRPHTREAIEDMLARTEHPQAPWHADRGRLEALRAREGDRDGERGDRAGDAGAGFPVP